MATGQELYFRQITTADGLSDNAITKLFQDRDGFLWVGTESGLNRYDGHHVRVWHARDGLGGEHVTDIVQDRHGAIWVATQEGGLARFNAQGQVQRSFRPDPGNTSAIRNLRLNCLFDLNDTMLMIGAQRTPVMFMDKRTGLFTYWKGTGPISPHYAVDRPMDGTDWCHYITDAGHGRLAIGFLLGHQQYLADRRDGRLLGQAFAMDLYADQSITAAVRSGNRLYGVGWQQRMHVRDLRTGAGLVWPLPDEGRAALADDSLHLLVGTAASGVLRVDLRNGTYRAMRHRPGDPRSLSDNRVRALLRDREGRTWVGTANGLNVHAPQRWWSTSVPMASMPAADDPAPVPFSIAELDSGELAVCTTQGLFVGNSDGPLRQLPGTGGPRPMRTTTLLPVAGGAFLGTEEGVFRCVRGVQAVPLTAPDPLAAPAGEQDRHHPLPALFQVRSLATDTFGGRAVLVMGVRGYGIAVLDLRDKHRELFYNEPGQATSLGSNLVNKLVRDAKGVYWAATSDGLYQWQLNRSTPRNEFRAFRGDGPASLLPANEILDLLPDADGRLWIATRNGGLAMWNGTGMKAYPLPAGAGRTVHGLALDRAGRLWCAARGAYAVLETKTGVWEVLPIPGDPGLPTVPLCTQGLRDGRIAFIADNALHVFDPALVPKPVAPPTPYLTGLLLADGSALRHAADGTLVLPTDAGPLQVEVSALDLAPAVPYGYTFELEGVDPAPRRADASGRLVYASLPAGTYRLLARTLDINGRSSTPVAMARIFKAAPIGQRWWFYWALAMATGGLAYIVSRYRYLQKLRLQQVRDRIASDLHDEVGSSLSAITIGSQLAASLSDQGSPQVKDIVARLGETSSASLRSIRDIVWAIDPKHDEGDALVARMRRIAQELLTDQGVDVSFNITGGVEHLKLPMGARKDLLLLFKEAVHNCSKHAGAGTVQVSLHRRSSRLWLGVKDDGTGFDPALHPDGHGLGSMARRARSLGAELVLKSAPGLGALVAVEVVLTKIRD